MRQVEDALPAWGLAGASRSAEWRLAQTRTGFTLSTPESEESFDGRNAARLSVSRWWFGRSLVVSGAPTRRYRGVTPVDARAIREAIQHLLARSEHAALLERACAFQASFSMMLAFHLVERRWIPHDRVDAILASRPSLTELHLPLKVPLEDIVTAQERDALALLGTDLLQSINAANARILRDELIAQEDFFSHVERCPLTGEQAQAVLTFDNRVRVIAAAGSGKTSVMVARAAYAISRRFVSPDRILMLAFNKDAATELQERTSTRMEALGLPHAGLRATTFHAFGRSLIGAGTGRKPTIARWVEDGKEIEKLSEIVDQLRDSSMDFRFKWDAFRLLYGRMSDSPDGGERDSYDRANRTIGFQTYKGDTVRSEGERLIADWLFLNGVVYRYEESYSHDVADSDHSQYRPDFFYPDIDVWHEHWALRADGTPPAAFADYSEGMAWKRNIHRHYGTQLVETTWHEIMSLDGLPDLARKLEGQGLALDWNPDRPIPGAEPISHERLVRLVKTFMSHVKASSLSRLGLAASLLDHPNPRNRLFLDLFWPIFDRWEQELRDTRSIDFDDMIVQSADLLERDPALRTYDLVLVDEFQDTSQSRARLVRALCAGPDKYLLAVGDDWQAINRFAGADLSAMTDFERLFGPGPTLMLQTTFRNTQRIADVASRFVSRNPSQLHKDVVAANGHLAAAPVTIVRVASRQALAAAIQTKIHDIATVSPACTVDVLGRYQHERQLMPHRASAEITLTFRTVHASKGLEADHVILPNLTTGTFGFPSQIADDPVLNLAMPDGDGFPHSEERRLFYVALTRARQSVTIFTVAGLESPFVVELLTDPDVVVQDSQGATTPSRSCPGCGLGTLVLRSGRYGEFYGCSTFPKCSHTVRLERALSQL